MEVLSPTNKTVKK